MERAQNVVKAGLTSSSDNATVLISDAFFPFDDTVRAAAKYGITAIVQPGGSIRDDNVIETCDKYGMTMAFTGIRLFHH